MALILVATLACVTLAHAYLGDGGSGYPGHREELYLLILMAAAGGLKAWREASLPIEKA